jgi:hypothetical protein
MSLHSDTSFWFWANQSLLFLVNTACLAEKQEIPILIVFGLTRTGLNPTIYRTRGEHANHYATDAVYIIIEHVKSWEQWLTNPQKKSFLINDHDFVMQNSKQN